MQCRHEAVFNIGRPRPIFDVHERGTYSLNTLVVDCSTPLRMNHSVPSDQKITMHSAATAVLQCCKIPNLY
jgi:hypothetical protein